MKEAILRTRCLPVEIPMPSLLIGRRGQITIPSSLRRELQLEEGGHLIARVKDGELVLRPAGRSIFELRGSVPVDGPQDFEAVRAQARDERARRTAEETDR
jgi:AbrB family looped-hinge helix DNA binding protein